MKQLALVIGISIAFGVGVIAYAATNIDTAGVGEKWGWNDVFGWVDMKASNTVMVKNAIVEGYASSSIGMISFDCATMAVPDCATAGSWKVANDGVGNLSGWAWNDAVGWISMSGTTAGGDNYQVKVIPSGNGTDSYFHGWAWSDIVGWLTFNCKDIEALPGGGGFCAGTNNYKTQTSTHATGVATNAEFVSSIFDIGTDIGVFNTIGWQGAQPSGSAVQFQIATATSSANLRGNMATIFASSVWMATSPSPASPTKLSASLAGVPVENMRYIRYKAKLTGNSNSPRIDDIMIGWSP